MGDRERIFLADDDEDDVILEELILLLLLLFPKLNLIRCGADADEEESFRCIFFGG